MKSYVIFNPAAARGKAGKRWPHVEKELESLHGPFISCFTEAPGHATQLTRKALQEGAEKIIAVGGDGTVNEVVNGWFENDEPIAPEAILSVFMFGSGCDFQRSLTPRSFVKPLPKDDSSGISRIDVGKVTFHDESDGNCIRYCANIASLGLSGEVDRFLIRHPKLKRLGGQALFLYATLVQVLSCPQFHLRLLLDDTSEVEIQSRLVAIANGQFFGGGMHVAPGALLDDGYFEVVWLEEMKLLTFLRHLPKVYWGKHIGIPGIQIKHAKKVEVLSQETVWLDIDGESPGKLDALFEILPGCLKIQL
jgi:YegS/Rv2252/BmrU family lipid kinase